MTSHIRIQRICDYCKELFTARTTVTKYCSHLCAKRDYKKRAKEKRIDDSNKETALKLAIPLEEIRANDYLTVAEAATLIRVSRVSLYRVIWSGVLKAIKVRSKIIIVKKDFDDYLLKSTIPAPVAEVPKSTEETELLSFPEILLLYQISETTLYSMARRKQITKKKINGTNYVPKNEIVKIFGNNSKPQ
ncbi:MAG: helix-turn-helix domain-containing protein [Bacteroidia bacterium]